MKLLIISDQKKSTFLEATPQSQEDILKPITFATVKLATQFPIRHQAYHLRGFFGRTFPEFSLLHNHKADGSRIQKYPLVQYKILGNKAYIIGINEGAKLLPILPENIHIITLGSTRYPITHREIVSNTQFIGVTRYPIYYQFITPWLALNPKNYRKYDSTYDWKEKKRLLNSILVGNCLSLAKGLGIFVPFKLFSHTHLDLVPVNFKNTQLKGFSGRFKINFQLPDLIGIGKGVSRGFGTILPIPTQN